MNCRAVHLIQDANFIFDTRNSKLKLNLWIVLLSCTLNVEISTYATFLLFLKFSGVSMLVFATLYIKLLNFKYLKNICDFLKRRIFSSHKKNTNFLISCFAETSYGYNVERIILKDPPEFIS